MLPVSTALAPGGATVNARLRMLHLFVVCVGTSLPAWVRATTASSTRSRENPLVFGKSHLAESCGIFLSYGTGTVDIPGLLLAIARRPKQACLAVAT